MIQLTLIVAFACIYSFESEMMRDWPLIVVIESVHGLHFVQLGCKLSSVPEWQAYTTPQRVFWPFSLSNLPLTSIYFIDRPLVL